MKEAEAKLLADALRVNSTVEYLNMTWCNLGDAGTGALAGSISRADLTDVWLAERVFCCQTAGIGFNEGLKAVDLRHNRVTAKALHAIASLIRMNVTLLELHLSESEVLIDGDDLIFENSNSESVIEQEQSDKSSIEHILASNRALSKVSRQTCTPRLVSDPLFLVLLMTIASVSLAKARRWILVDEVWRRFPPSFW